MKNTFTSCDALRNTEAKVSMDARFLEEVEQRMNGSSPQVAKTINDTVPQTYEACYDGMRNAVVKAAGSREVLKTALSTVTAVTPDVIRAAVNNPISGLTLKDTLEKHRKEIIYDIKRNIGVGLSNGDRFTTMAKRISQSLDSDYNKSIRIVRTEAHRVREAGFHDSATAINDILKQGNSGYVMAKTWKTMDDERVRPNTVYKTKKGWKKGKKSKYNHEKMDGVTIPVDGIFQLPSGAKGKAPAQTGVAGEDINCRCYLSYDLVEVGILDKGKNAFVDGGDKNNFMSLPYNTDYVKIEWPPKGQNITSEEFKDLRNYAKEKGISLEGFKKSDVDIELSKELIDVTSEMINIFPELKNEGKFTLRLKSMPSADLACTMPGLKGFIDINPDALRSKDTLIKEYNKLLEDGSFPKGTNYKSVIYHEIGHLFEDYHKEHNVLDIAMKVTGFTSKYELLIYLKQTLSLYSAKLDDGGEILSECFSVYFNSNENNEFVLNMMKRYGIIK